MTRRLHPDGPMQTSSGVFAKALRNAGLLLTGKASAGLLQLASFALAARGLGLAEFGVFSMLLAQVQLLTGLAAFQSNQAIIRYGVEHLEGGDTAAFQRLLKAGTLLDVLAAGLALAAAVVLAPVIGGQLAWDDRLIAAAQMISLLAFTNAIATPKGVLRLFGRFDLLAQHSVVTPLGRLLGVIACYLLDTALFAYLAVWLVAGFAGAVVAIWLGWREAARRDLLRGMDLSMRGLTEGNAGIWRFSIIANLHSSMALVPNHLATFLVGAILTPAASGLLRIARELGTAFSKPVELLNQSIYPDVARLANAGEWTRLARTVVHSGLVAAGTSALVTIAIVFAGRSLIGLVFGSEYVAAHEVLVMISAATTASVLVFAVDPALYSLGRPSRSLITALVSAAVFTLVLVLRTGADGLSGAGWAYLAASAITVALQCFWFYHHIRGRASSG